MATGKVKRFIEAKGYGFILPDDGTDDVFVHISAVQRAGRSTLTAGQKLRYDTRKTSKGVQATNLKFIEDPDSGSAARKPETGTPRRSAGGSGDVRKQGTVGGDSSRANSNAAQHRIIGYERNGEGLKFDTGHQTTDRCGNPVPVKVESLKVTDRFLAARPGTVFEAFGSDLKPVQYDPDVSVGPGAPDGVPDVDQNPYNFAPWIAASNPSDAEAPLAATHDEVRSNRLSGSIEVEFTARTPVFVPVGEIREQRSTVTPQDFFHCWDGDCERYAIPGASVKGVVRSLFEALTNSRAGVTDESALGKPPLYRRRAYQLFKITKLPSGPGSPGKVQQCDYGLRDKRNKWNPRTNGNLPDPSRTNGVEESAFAANLFWVVPSKHLHPWETIRYRPNGNSFDLHCDTIKRFTSMKDHPHLEAHGGPSGNAASASRKFYHQSPPDYSRVKCQLFALEVGDLVFGIPRNGRLHCFGRNVNFLWPAGRTAEGMMGKFSARAPDASKFGTSDPAEATFGFAGTHRGDSHPFRGRVRFGTFWGPEISCEELEERPYLQLMPLTSPSGTKAKARPLYLNPGNAGKSADYDDDKAVLRGRKFYWHQKGGNGDVPLVHRFDKLQQSVPETWKENIRCQLPAQIRPLPVDTCFNGKIHFSNLTCAELGALLVAVKPDLAFEESDWKETPRYGIKIGKGKPRGLGSVTSHLTLRLDDLPRNMYGSLDANLWKAPDDDAVRRHVCAYKKWMTPSGRSNWNGLEFAKALKKLLRLPDASSARVYPPQFMMYGWLPHANDSDGSPSGGQQRRPKAMTPAHEMN